MREIPLTQGLVTLVDDADYERFAGFRWHAHRRQYTWYAGRNMLCGGERRVVRLHRLVLDAPVGIEVDHVDGDGLNNTRANLRLCGDSQNNWNQRPIPGGTSRFKGVSWYQSTGKWRAVIGKYGRWHYLGYFLDEEAAARAYNEAALDLFGEFARLNTFSREVEVRGHEPA